MTDDADPRAHKVPRGMNRATMVGGFNIPLIWFPVVIGVPVMLAMVERNIFYAFAMPFLIKLARQMSDDSDRSFRRSWLRLTSGSTFAFPPVHRRRAQFA
jgi:hypothetical protein